MPRSLGQCSEQGQPDFTLSGHFLQLFWEDPISHQLSIYLFLLFWYQLPTCIGAHRVCLFMTCLHALLKTQFHPYMLKVTSCSSPTQHEYATWKHPCIITLPARSLSACSPKHTPASTQSSARWKIMVISTNIPTLLHFKQAFDLATLYYCVPVGECVYMCMIWVITSLRIYFTMYIFAFHWTILIKI